jgi:hypothetical protein
MNNFLNIPIVSVTALTSEKAGALIHTILRAECAYAKLSPAVLTISSQLTVADGGIDAQVDAPSKFTIPRDCIFQSSLTGFQIKSGTAFKPWQKHSIRDELLDRTGNLNSEVERLVRSGGRYILVCTGHDLTPEQRNGSRHLIAMVLEEVGFGGREEQIEVLGARQVAEFAERYPGTASLLTPDPIQEALVVEEWQLDTHMANVFEASPEQSQMIARIREELQGEIKHIRLLGEPGLGKTRIVLESVKDENIAPYVLYIQHGSRFGQTKLFRQLLKVGHDKPLVLVLDELPESELSDIWSHLKQRCGCLKLISLDHGRDETHDEEIDRLDAPRLPDETIKKILASRVGESLELDRWVAICEGSPRVALAVADNLRANPGDILKPPSTIPIWDRYLHGYGKRNEDSARQVDCVAQHLALFSRFGYEAPVGGEAEYIGELIQIVDPTIGWARFQEIVQKLRARRVLQGSKTLFFAPKPLHIFLWKQFWECYGRGFDFSRTFKTMPESLHFWFMSMFRYAEGAATSHVIGDILRPEGFFSQRTAITSSKGSRFLSILAEANPAGVLKLLESTIGKWTDQELLNFKDTRQQLVWTLEKIAVWPLLTARSIQLLIRLAVNENADFSNNSTGTLIGLFRIGPEAAATESSPEARLPAMLQLLRSLKDAERHLGLKAMKEALDTHGMSYRIVGPEFQGLKQRANLWKPKTYAEWGEAYHLYFQVLVSETQNWPPSLCPQLKLSLLEAVEHQLLIPPCTELALQTLNNLIEDKEMPSEKLNAFFRTWRKYKDDGKHPDITKTVRSLENRYIKRDLVSRFNRYVIDVDLLDWDDDGREHQIKKRNRSKILVDALARRIARYPEKFFELQHLIAPNKYAPALWHFGEQLGQNDRERVLLKDLIRQTLETKHKVCLHGYLSAVRTSDYKLYRSIVISFFDLESTAWLGAAIVLDSDYTDDLFVLCLESLEKKWITPLLFASMRYGKVIEFIPSERVGHLFRQLYDHEAHESLVLLVELLCLLPFNGSSPFSPDFVFKVATHTIQSDEHRVIMHEYNWKKICLKLIKWDNSYTLPLLNVLLIAMSKDYRLSCDHYVQPLANELASYYPSEAWQIVKKHLESTLPKWNSSILHWLNGGHKIFDENAIRGAIADFPIPDILEWIDVDPESRAPLIAHAAPGTLDDEYGGRLTQELLRRYGKVDGVTAGISVSLHSGGWSGPESAYLKRKRDKLRRWLAAGFAMEITQWIEAEVGHLDRNIEREEMNEEREGFY